MTNKTQNTAEMDDREFWQRVALEAIANDDPSKALAMRVESFFDKATAYPRQTNKIRVKGVRLPDLQDWLSSIEFDYENIEETQLGVLIEGVEYTEYEEY